MQSIKFCINERHATTTPPHPRHLHIANSQWRQAYLALLPADERERANENATGSGVCENHFSTIAGESKGGKACSTDTTPRLASLTWSTRSRPRFIAKEEGERGFYVRHSKRQRKDSAVRAANWNGGADSADPALRERWYVDPRSWVPTLVRRAP